MLKKLILSIGLSLLVAAGFFCPKNAGYPQNLPKMVWKSTTLYSDDITNFGGDFEQKIYEDKIITIGAKGRSFDQYIVAKSLETGEDVWKWRDFVEGSIGEINYQDNIHTYHNLMALQRVGVLHIIDMNTGKTAWKKVVGIDDGGHHGTVGIGKYFFFFGLAQGTNRPLILFRANIETGDMDTVTTIRSGNPNDPRDWNPNDDDNYRDNVGATLTVHVEEESGDTLLVFIAEVHKLNVTDIETQQYLTIYNMTKQEKVLSTRANEENPPWPNMLNSKPPKIYKGRLYFDLKNQIVCAELKTGKILWRWSPETKDTGFISSGFIIVENKLIANCEDTWMYCLDPETGRELWREKSSGGSSEMLYLDSVVYFTGGGDGLFHAVNINQGKHLWKVVSPDEAHNSDAFFSAEEPVLDEDGRIYIRSFESLFCYELK